MLKGIFILTEDIDNCGEIFKKGETIEVTGQRGRLLIFNRLDSDSPTLDWMMYIKALTSKLSKVERIVYGEIDEDFKLQPK